MSPVFWTCRCGARNVSPRVAGSPTCTTCHKLAEWQIEAPKTQGALFGWPAGDDGRGDGSKSCRDGD